MKFDNEGGNLVILLSFIGYQMMDSLRGVECRVGCHQVISYETEKYDYLYVVINNMLNFCCLPCLFCFVIAIFAD